MLENFVLELGVHVKEDTDVETGMVTTKVLYE